MAPRPGIVHALARVPSYVWAFIALTGGIVLGGTNQGALEPVARGTRIALSFVVQLAPLLIVAAVSPAVAKLVRRGLAGKLIGTTLGWFLFSSIVASLLGLLLAGLLFRLPLASQAGAAADVVGLLSELAHGGASAPVLAVLAAAAIGSVGARSERLNALLERVEVALAGAGAYMGRVLAPLVLALGIMIGVNFGARVAAAHYGAMIAYSAFMAIVWWAFYTFVLLRFIARVRDFKPLMKLYYFPTALFAGGTCSSLATIPVNIANIKKYGVTDEVADFVIPVGTVAHKCASAMQYMAYGPLIAGQVFGLHISWLNLAVVWPFVVIYSMAAPGVPGAMGLSLWTGVLYASLLGLEDPLRSTFVGTWVALSGGIPDMFRSSGNATSDGFSAIVIDSLIKRRSAAVLIALLVLPAMGCYEHVAASTAIGPAGTEVRVLLSDSGYARIAREVLHDVPTLKRSVTGELVQANEREVLLAVRVWTNERDPGNALSQRIGIPRADILQLEVKQVDRRKTAVLAVAITLGVTAFVVSLLSGQFGGSTVGSGPSGGELRDSPVRRPP